MEAGHVGIGDYRVPPRLRGMTGGRWWMGGESVPGSNERPESVVVSSNVGKAETMVGTCLK